jgi:hypothetical protein
MNLSNTRLHTKDIKTVRMKISAEFETPIAVFKWPKAPHMPQAAWPLWLANVDRNKMQV